MELIIRSQADSGYFHVAVEGQITSADLDEGVSNPLDELLGSTWSAGKLILDLKGVTYMDSTGIGWLVGSNRKIKGGGGKLVVHSIHPNIAQMLELLKIGSLMPLVEDEQAAIAALDTPSDQASSSGDEG